MAAAIDQKGGIDTAQIEDFEEDKHTADLIAAQQATLQEAKGIIETVKEDKKLFAIVAAALVGSNLSVKDFPRLIITKIAILDRPALLSWGLIPQQSTHLLGHSHFAMSWARDIRMGTNTPLGLKLYLC